MLNLGDFTKIDEISKNFANIFYRKLKQSWCIVKNDSQENLETLFKSEHSIYMLIFALIVTDINLNKFSVQPSKVTINKIFYDLMIILKNLNDGKNFNSAEIKEYFNFVKVMGLVETSPEINSMFDEIKKSKSNFVKIWTNVKSEEYK